MTYVDLRVHPCLDCDDPCWGIRCRRCSDIHSQVLKHALAGRHASALARQQEARDTDPAADRAREQTQVDHAVAYLGGWRRTRGGVLQPIQGRGAA